MDDSTALEGMVDEDREDSGTKADRKEILLRNNDLDTLMLRFCLAPILVVVVVQEISKDRAFIGRRDVESMSKPTAEPR